MTSTTGVITGEVVQETSSIEMTGTIQLMPEVYLTATPDSTVTLDPTDAIKVNLDKDNKFTINNIKPGRYYLDVSLTLNPCFLGEPGQIFNGGGVWMMDNWDPMGFSFTDGTSLVTGKTDVYEISAGKSLDVTLKLPKCY